MKSLKVKLKQKEFVKRFYENPDYISIYKDLGISKSTFSQWKKDDIFKTQLLLISEYHKNK